MRRALALLAVLAPLVALVPVGTLAQPAAPDNLPPESRVSDPLRRAPDGTIERVGPKAGAETDAAAGTQATRGPCARGTLCVGKGRRYPTIAKAMAAIRDGDTVEILAGTYRETFVIERSNVTLRGAGGRVHIDCAGLRPARDKACVVLAGDNVTLENLEISGAEVTAEHGANAACVRNEKDRSFTLRGIACHHSQNGLLTDGGTVLIEGSEFFENSWNGFTHNVYFSGNCPSVTVRNSTFRDARVAHEFKSRCRQTLVANSTFRNNKGSRAIDLPDGGDVLITDSVIIQGRNVQNPEIIAFAPESCRNPGTLRVLRTRIVTGHNDAAIVNYGKCANRSIILEGVTFEGKRPLFRGDILER